jgi:hypothetical protein
LGQFQNQIVQIDRNAASSAAPAGTAQTNDSGGRRGTNGAARAIATISQPATMLIGIVRTNARQACSPKGHHG